MKRTPKFGRVPLLKVRSGGSKADLTDWFLNASDKASALFERAVLKTAEEALEVAFENGHTFISFPAEWGDSDGLFGKKRVRDPLTIYLTVGVGTYDFSGPVYKFNLREALADSIEACAEDGSFSDGLARVSKALKSLASEIDVVTENKR